MTKEDLIKKYGEVHSAELGIIIPSFPHDEEGMKLFNEYVKTPEIAAEIKEQKLGKIKRLLELSDINERWADRKLETFEERDKEATNMKKFALKYIANWPSHEKEGKGVFLHGSVGVGKTHLVCAIAQELIERYYVKTMYFSVPKLLVKIDPFLKDPETRKLYNNMVNCDLLIFDDLDKSTLNDYSVRFVYMIVNDRYENKKPMIFTSNRDIDELPPLLSSANMKMSGEAIVDRIMGMCIVAGVSKRNSERGKLIDN